MSAQDVTGVFDANLNQVFPGARPMRALVRDVASFPKQPLESGASVSDNRIFEPIEIELSMILTPETVEDIYQQMRTAYQSTTALSVQTLVQTYPDMYIQGLPFDATPAVFDTISVSLKLRQIQFVEAQYAALPASRVAKPGNSSTVHTGQRTPQAATPAQTSVAYGLFHGGHDANHRP